MVPKGNPGPLKGQEMLLTTKPSSLQPLFWILSKDILFVIRVQLQSFQEESLWGRQTLPSWVLDAMLWEIISQSQGIWGKNTKVTEW